MSEQEDLVVLQNRIRDLKIECFDHCTFLLRNGVANTGHKSVADGLLYTVKYYNNKINDLTKSHLKKYPD